MKTIHYELSDGIATLTFDEPAECVNDFATPGVINLLCSVVYLFAPPVLVD